MAEPDRGLLFVFQVVHTRCFRCDEGIECELRAEAEAGDEAVEGGLSVDGCPGIDILDKPFLLLAGELIREEVLVIGEDLHMLSTVALCQTVFFPGVGMPSFVSVVAMAFVDFP